MKKRPSIRLCVETLESRVVPSVYNVDSYGAVGDGQTDDTVAIRAAISAAEAAGGGTIYFPAGTYLVSPQASDPVTVEQPIFQLTGSNLTFEGAGPGLSNIDGLCIGDTNPVTHWRVNPAGSYFAITRFGLFNITSSSTTGPISNISFEGLTMDGDAGYTGDSQVGGNPTTGDGWDLSNKAILLNGSQPVNNVSVTDCTLCNWRGEIVYAGGNEIGTVNLTNDLLYGTNADAVSVSGNLVMTNVTIGGSSPGMDCYNGVEDFAVVPTQGTTAIGCTFECSSNAADPHGNGIVYGGLSGSALVVTNCEFINNAYGILFSEVAYNVTVSGSLFQNNKQATITSILGLDPGYPTGFDNFAFIGNSYDDTGAAFLSQNQVSGLLFSDNTVTNSVLLEGNFGEPTGSDFVVEDTILGIGASDVDSYSGNVALWSGTTRLSPSTYSSYGDYANDFSNETTTEFTPLTDYTILNYNITKGTQTATLTPSMIGMYPIGFSTTIYSWSDHNWVLPVDPTWNDFTAPIPVPATGVTIVVGADGKFTLLSSTNSAVGFAAGSIASDSTDTLTIDVNDANGNPISDIPSGDFGFSLSGGTSTGTFGPVTPTATPGVYTVAFTGATAGTASTLTTTIDGTPLVGKPTITVTPGPVSGTLSTITPMDITDVSSSTNTLTIAVKNGSGNPVAGLPSSAFQFTLAGGTSAGTFGAVTQTATPGTYTVAFTGITAGTASTLTATILGVTLTAQPIITVVPGAVNGYVSTLSMASSTDISGSTDTLTIAVMDADSNPITGLASNAFQFTLAGGTSAGTFGVVTQTATPGTYTVAFTGTTAAALTASILSTTVEGVSLTVQPTIAVTPGPISGVSSTVALASDTNVSGGTDTLTIAVMDAAGNPISGLASSAFQFTLSGGTSAGTFGTVSATATPGTYTLAFTGTTAGTAGTLTTTIDGVTLTAQPTITVIPGPVSETLSTISAASASDASGSADTWTIVVKDVDGNPISDLPGSDFDFSLSGGASTGTFGTVTPTATPGTYTAAFIGTTAGTASTLTTILDGVTLTAQPTITVVPGTVSGTVSRLSLASATDISGGTDTLTIAVEDSAGNPITGLSNSAFQFSLSGGTSAGTFGTVTPTGTAGTYTVAFTGTTAGTASTLTTTISGVALTDKPTITVTPGAVSGAHSTTSLASATDISGGTDTLTIAVEDAAGNPITGLSSSSFQFSLAGGTSAGTFGTVTPTGTAGTYKVTFTGTTAGTASTLTTTISGVTLTDKPTITVTPGAVNGAHSTTSLASGTDVSGSTDTLTIAVKDAAGNPITGLSNSAFQFGLSGGTSAGTFGTVTPTGTAGTYTAAFTGTTAGTASTLTTTISGVALTDKPTITVTPGAVSGVHSTTSLASGTDISGGTDTLTIAVQDAAGNPITGLSSSAFQFSLTGGTSAGFFGTVTPTGTAGTYTAAFTGTTAGTASTLTTTISGVALTDKPTITVTPGAVSGVHSTTSLASGTDISGGTDTLTIAVEDAAGNPITGLSNNAFQFSLAGGTSAGSFGTVTPTGTAGTYTVAFTGTTAGTASTLTTVVDGVTLTAQPAVTVISGAVSTLSTVDLANDTDVSGGTDTLTIAVEDAAGNPITGLSNNAFQFSLAGGTSAGTFGIATPTGTAGTYSVAFTGTTAGTASTLTTIVDGVTLTAQPAVTVISGAVNALSTVGLASGTDISGGTDTLTIAVEDAAGNPITGLSSNAFQFSLAGGTSAGSFGTVTPTGTAGTYTVAFTGTTAGTASTLTTIVDGVTLTAQPAVTVISGAVNALSTVGLASGTDISGGTDTLTIAVEDAAGNPITGLSSNAFQFSLTGGTSAGAFGTVSETGTAGTYTAAFTGTTAGTASTLTTIVDGVTLTAQPAVTVISGAVNALSTVGLASDTDVSGGTDTLTIAVEDAAGNPITGLSSNAFQFSLTGGTSAGAFGTVSETGTAGTYTAAFTGTTVGTASTLTTVVDGVTLTAQPAVTVISGAVNALSTVGLASGTDISGGTDTLTIAVEDAAGNPITGLSSNAFQFSLTGGTSAGAFGTVSETGTAGTYTAAFTGTTVGTASTLTTVVDGVTLTAQPAVTVISGAVSTLSTVDLASDTDVSGGTDTLTIAVEDAAGNPITGLSNNAFQFSLTGGTSAGAFGTVSETGTAGTYSVAFTGTTAGTASTLTTVVDGVTLTAQPAVTVISGAVNALSTVGLASGTDVSGGTDTLTIAVEDAAGNPITGLSSSAFQFSLAGGTSAGTFGIATPTGTAGTYSVAFTGTTAGTASTLTTIVDGVTLTAQPAVTVISGAVNALSTVGLASDTDVSGGTDTLTIAVEDAAGNPITGLSNNAFQFSFAGGTSAGTFGIATPTGTAGTYSVAFTGTTAGTASTLTTIVDGVTLTAQPAVTVISGAVNALSTVGLASGTDISGGTDTLTIAVEDAAGNPITGLSNSAFQFSLTGGTSAGSFGTVSETGTAGTYSVAFTGTTAGTASTLTTIVDGVTLTAQPAVTVISGAVNALSTVGLASDTDVSGGTDTLTIAVEDAAGNPITGLSNNAFQFSFAGGTSAGSFGTVSETGAAGTYTVAFTGTTAGTASTLTTIVDGVTLTAQPAVTVTTGAVSGVLSTVSVANVTDILGSTDLLTIVVQDADGNPISGLPSSAFQFGLIGGTSAGTFGEVSGAADPGTYTVAFTGTISGMASTPITTVDGVTLGNVGSPAVTENGTLLTAQPSITVIPGAVSKGHTDVSVAMSKIVTGKTETLTIKVKDTAGKAILGLASSAFQFSLSGGTGAGTFGMVTEKPNKGTYTVTFAATTPGTSSSLTVVVDGVTLTSKPKIKVTPGSVSSANSSICLANPTIVSNSTETLTIVVKDANGYPLTGLASNAFRFTLAGGASAGTFGSVTQTATKGTYTVAFTGTTAGTASTLTTTVDGISLATKPTITVAHGPVNSARSSLALAESTIVTGKTDALTIVVKDAEGNAIGSLASSAFEFSLAEGTSAGTFGAVTETATKGTYKVTFTGTTSGTASSLSAIIDGVTLAVRDTIKVKQQNS